MSCYTIFVVDDDPSVRKAVSRLLSAAFAVQSFASPEEFLLHHDPSVPGCVVLDLAMPGLNGLELQEALRNSGCERFVVFLSGHADIPSSVQAMKSGAVDFLTKPVDRDDFLRAIGVALERDSKARTMQEERHRTEERLATLTPRERQVLQHVVSGQLNKQIAADLGTSEKTVKVHRGRVMEKLAVRSLADLVRMAGRVGIASPPAPPQLPDTPNP